VVMLKYLLIEVFMRSRDVEVVASSKFDIVIVVPGMHWSNAMLFLLRLFSRMQSEFSIVSVH